MLLASHTLHQAMPAGAAAGDNDTSLMHHVATARDMLTCPII